MDDKERRPLLLLGRAYDPEDADYAFFKWARAREARRLAGLLILICISLVLLDFSILLSSAPQLSILENSVCTDHYPTIQPVDSDITQAALELIPPITLPNITTPPHIAPNRTRQTTDETFCKGPIVQSDLRYLTGWKDTYDAFPGIILALPYGYAADRVGRRRILLLSLTGIMFESIFTRLVIWWHSGNVVPLEALWLVPVWQILGGGPPVASGMAYAMVTDLFPGHNRAKIFFFIGAAIIVSEALAISVSGMMTTLWGPWVPFLATPFLQLLAFITAIFLPETLHMPEWAESEPDTELQVTSFGQQGTGEEEEYQDDDEDDDEDDRYSFLAPTDCSWGSGDSDCDMQELDLKQLYTSTAACRQELSLFLKKTNVSYLAFAVFFASVGRQTASLIGQYAAKRFDWDTGASLLMTFKGLISLLTLCYLLPDFADFWEERWVLSPQEKDHFVTKCTSWILVGGAVLMGLSGSASVVFALGVAVLAVGWGYFAAVRNLGLAMVEHDEIGMMNSLLGWVHSLGNMVAGPTLMVTLGQGFKEGGFWAGVPWLVVALFFTAAACAVSFGVQEYQFAIPDASKTGNSGATGSDEWTAWEQEVERRKEREAKDEDARGYVTDVGGSTGTLFKD